MSAPLLLTNARVVDGRGVVADEAGIRIEGGLISHVGNSDRAEHDTSIDVHGKTVTPGLMNAHVHICFDGSADPKPRFSNENDVTSTLAALPRLVETLQRGVTTVRDLGGKEQVTIGLAEGVERGLVNGPRIIPSGRVVTTTGGHGHWMGLEVEGTDDARGATRKMIDAGARVIKVMATAGMMTPGQMAGAPQLTTGEMSACVEEAHKARIPVAAHVEGREGAANALEAGVDSIEHGHGVDEHLLQLMKDNEVALVPTVSCDRVIVRQGLQAGVPHFLVEDCARLAPTLEWALRRAIEMGVTIAAGNDGGTPLTHPGDIVDELAVYVEMGMSPTQALASATTNTASLFGMTDVGLVSSGQRADLLVLDGDPTTSVEALREPTMVIAAGRVVHEVSHSSERRSS